MKQVPDPVFLCPGVSAIVIWPLVGFWKWHKDARDDKQAEAHDPENSSSDVGRDEHGTGREGSSAVHGQLYRLLRL